MLEQSIVDRFWSKVAIIDDEDSCWLWTAASTGRYGVMWVNGRNEIVSRLSYMIDNDLDELATYQFICHTCDNGHCVRPSHLFLGTPYLNMRDKFNKGRANTPKGDSHYGSKIDQGDAACIRFLYRNRDMSSQQLSDKFGISRQSIADIVYNRTWVV